MIMREYLRKKIWVNACPHDVVADPERSLAEIIRKQLGLTGTKIGCGKGQCAAPVPLS
jgi:aldehyde oxidoreductase